MLPLGMPAPDFSLKEPATGKLWVLADFRGKKGLLVVFMCNHCPYVVHLKRALAGFASEYLPKGLGMIGINANDIENYPEDSPENMVRETKKFGYSFPYVFDETQEVAKIYHADCTPDFFLFNAGFRLAYRGRFDETRPGRGQPTGKDLRDAAEALLAGRAIPSDQKPSMGCSIKWK